MRKRVTMDGLVRECRMYAETGRAVVRFRGRELMLLPVDRCDSCDGDMTNEAGGSPWVTPSVPFSAADFAPYGVVLADGMPECVGYVEELGGAVCDECYA